jgi:hypothetical protein
MSIKATPCFGSDAEDASAAAERAITLSLLGIDSDDSAEFVLDSNNGSSRRDDNGRSAWTHKSDKAKRERKTALNNLGIHTASDDDADSETSDSHDDATDPTSSTHHKTVFPGMKFPVSMRNNKDRRAASEELATMALDSPFPTTTTITTITDPIEKVSWGPNVRIEASKEAKKAITKWTRIKKDQSDESDESDETDDADGPLNKPQHTLKTDRPPPTSRSNSNYEKSQDISTGNTSNDETRASQTESDAPRSNISRTLMPPPPTPPDTIFHQRLSMPTIPNGLHRISDVILIDTYRLQRAINPERFDNETKSIKQGLISAKIARGGKPRLLKNEYTVELASREDAAMAEKWASSPVRVMRSRGSTISNTTEAGTVDENDLKLRGGKSGTTGQVETADTHAGGNAATTPSTSSATAGTQSGSVEYDPLTTITNATAAPLVRVTTTASAESTATAHRTTKSTRRDLKKLLKTLDLGEHVSKVTTSGSVWHQNSMKREITDLGEKRTVTTWIKIEEVFEVPSARALGWSDVLAAAEHGNGRNPTKKAVKVRSNKTRARRDVSAKNKKGKGNKDSTGDARATKGEPGSSDETSTSIKDLMNRLARLSAEMAAADLADLGETLNGVVRNLNAE